MCNSHVDASYALFPESKYMFLLRSTSLFSSILYKVDKYPSITMIFCAFLDFFPFPQLTRNPAYFLATFQTRIADRVMIDI